MLDSPCIASDEVTAAVVAGEPVVALESTIISHGMPYPRNVETALGVERVVRENGAVPATVAVIDGAIRVGLATDQIELLGTAEHVHKASRRDLGWALSGGHLAATTVATTMIGANMAGVSVFATGGTGGVHRGWQETLDISADLTELARTPVAVVSAGVKAILDIEHTLEYLETHGVPVVTVGSDEFPAFYSRSSGLRSPLSAATPEAVAEVAAAHWRLPHAGGLLVANPIPSDAEIAYSDIAGVIEQAVGEARAEHVTGREVTPYLLARIVELTGGASLAANIALVRHNALVAARIAVRLAALPRA